MSTAIFKTYARLIWPPLRSPHQNPDAIVRRQVTQPNGVLVVTIFRNLRQSREMRGRRMREQQMSAREIDQLRYSSLSRRMRRKALIRM